MKNRFLIPIKGVLHNYYLKFLSKKTKDKIEVIFISISIASFLLHLLLLVLVKSSVIKLVSNTALLKNPISAIYTPFSFVLVYEVYLLVYYLPKSTTIYIGKQYEIITLIVVRHIFKDLTSLKLVDDWYFADENILFGFDLLATILLFYLIYKFYKLNQVRESRKKMLPQKNVVQKNVAHFIQFKKILAMVLIPIFVILSIYSFANWLHQSFNIVDIVTNIKDINKIFFDDFFAVLIWVEVLLLLVSFFISDNFSNIVRNSGYIISTILIKLSFGTEGILSTLIIVIAVLFGVLVLVIHNKYETLNLSDDD